MKLRTMYRISLAAFCDMLLWFMVDVLTFRVAKGLHLDVFEQLCVCHYNGLFGKEGKWPNDEENERTMKDVMAGENVLHHKRPTSAA